MKRVIALADRSAMPALKLLAAANVLFLISFAVMLALATGEARGEIPACKGIDMLAALERDDPALLARIRAEAAATPNGDSLLWKLEKAGQEPSFLFGTMHMTDPRVTSLTPAAERAFDASRTVVIETTDVLDPAKMLAGMMKRPELTMFIDGTTLASHMSPEDAEAVEKALDERGIPPATVAKMKPWMLSAMLALPACELARKAAGAPVLDVKLAEDAKAAGKRLEGLETITDQLEAMASLPIEFHMQGLIDTLKLGDKTDDVIETMIVLYQSGQTGMYWPLFRAVLPGSDEDEAGYAAFEETMVTARNRNMAEKAAPILDEGDAFIAVGALHLPGPNGLVELLRKEGYTVSAVN
ncbi:TraB/GumN family protein [Allomesorhizobium alhagi]|uniref:GumN family protein n=1 Tax=Mesorhizobium alhagi CCNWXJ12-2 TaxID=1107882 RepID=H0HL74_9HYPH|nr:TraB/GumN family protein [Mesorhizobium alhagi]EHK58558.1 GumN family protein [Mesorhizobium alhagi CCNWXJ12-2]